LDIVPRRASIALPNKNNTKVPYVARRVFLYASGGKPDGDATAMQVWMLRKNILRFDFHRTKKLLFLFGPCTARFSFSKKKKKNGGCK